MAATFIVKCNFDSSEQKKMERIIRSSLKSPNNAAKLLNSFKIKLLLTHHLYYFEQGYNVFELSEFVISQSSDL